MVSNLWDVTDRDIDRFCEALLSTWLGPKTATTTAEAITAAAAAAASGRHEAAGAGSSQCGIGAAVSRSRSACKLPYLIGAAPVCYGIPTEAYYYRRPD